MSPNKIERFTQRARRVLSLAQESAERLEHHYIGTEHLLLGLLREEGGIAARVLRDLGIEERTVEQMIAESSQTAPHIHSRMLDLSPDTKRVLELAVDEARRMGHHYIGTEHLLLGLVRQTEGAAIDVLKRLGVSPEAVRQAARRVLQEAPQQPQTPSVPPPVVPTPIASRRVFSPAGLSHPFQIQFQFVENTITKILDMVEDAKISSAQAAELLGGIFPDLRLTPGEQARIGSLVSKPETADKQHVTVTVQDKATSADVFQMQMPLKDMLDAIDGFLSSVGDNQPARFTFDSADGTKQFIVEITQDAE